MTDEKRIYVVVPALVQIADGRYVQQPAGRQIAQACHVVSKLRHQMDRESLPKAAFESITTIILQARDSAELCHVYELFLRHKKLSRPVLFSDENKAAYADFHPITAMAVLATKKGVEGILDYLPLWGN